MVDYKVVITNNGLDRLEQAMADGEKLVLKEMSFGDAFGEPYIPTVTQEDLKHKIFSKPITEAAVVEGVVRYKSTLLSTDPEGNFLELGLHFEDGSLFAVANIPRLEHRHSDSGSVTETDVTVAMVAENAEHITIAVTSGIYLSKDYANTYYIRTDGENNVLQNISMNDHKLINVKSGTASTDVATISQIKAIGEVYLWAGVNTPSNSKECDGMSYSRLGETAELYKVIGTLYGKGDGSLSFNVPKLSPPDPNQPDIRYVIKYRH